MECKPNEVQNSIFIMLIHFSCGLPQWKCSLCKRIAKIKNPEKNLPWLWGKKNGDFFLSIEINGVSLIEISGISPI